MTDWEEFFRCLKDWDIGSLDGPFDWVGLEDFYQAFKARGEAEARGPLLGRCQCPGYDLCLYRGGHGSITDLCNHPSNKASEPECEDATHQTYKGLGDEHCRDCGEKLE